MANLPVSQARKIVGANLGTCLNFSTSSADVVTVPANASFAVTGNFSVSFWCNQRSVGASNGGRVLEGGGFQLLFTGTNTAQMSNNGSNKTSSSYIFDTNKWTHIAVTYDGSYVYFYKNGALWNKTAQTTNPNQSGDLTVGNRAAGDRCVDGYLDDIRIYKDRVLATDEIALLAAGGSPTTTGLGLWLKFDEGSGTDALDSSGNSNTGIITTATYSSAVAINIPARTAISSRRFAPRAMGKSLYFNGSSSVLTFPILSDDTTGFSLGFWLKNRAFSNLGCVIDTRDSGLTNGFNLEHSTSGGYNHLIFNVKNTTNTVGQVAGDTMLVNKWYHVVLTYAVNSTKLYINSVLKGTDTSCEMTANATGILTFARRASGAANYVNMGICDLIYKKGLAVWTQDEITEMYYTGKKPTGSILTCSFNNAVTDSSGNGNNGTLSNGTYSTDVPFSARSAV